MSPRLTSAMLVAGLLRRTSADGGTGVVIAKGDSIAGAVLLLFAERGKVCSMRERGLLADGTSGWIKSGPADLGDDEITTAYIERRRRSDPDLWVVELDAADVSAIEYYLAE